MKNCEEKRELSRAEERLIFALPKGIFCRFSNNGGKRTELCEVLLYNSYLQFWFAELT